MSVERVQGLVLATCLSPNHGFPTYPRDKIIIRHDGVVGDAHSGPLRESFHNPGTFKPNDRPISIVSDEVRREMNDRYWIEIQPGGFNEQILVSGLGDLSNVEVGDAFMFEGGVSLSVVDTAYPCAKLAKFHKTHGLVKALDIRATDENRRRSRRGTLARVLKTGALSPGEVVTLFKYS